jgi:chromosome segregation ATPase
MDNRTIEEVKANEAKLIEKINELENINDKLSQALSSSEQKLEQMNAVADTNSELADHYKNKLDDATKYLEDKVIEYSPKIKVVEATEENMSIPIEMFEKTKEEIKKTYEKTQDWDRWRFVCNIVQMQHDIEDLTSCINVYRKDMDKAIKILGGKK